MMIVKVIAPLMACGLMALGITDGGEANKVDIYSMAMEATEIHSPKELLNYSGRGIAPEAYTIDDFPIVWQMPELPTGCEVTALAMVLKYYGFDVDKVELATRYLPTASPSLYVGRDGRLYGPDLNEAFIGDPASEFGIICGVPAIISAADGYLRSQDSALRAKDLTGSKPEELYDLVSCGTPVLVWVTIEMEDRYGTQGWYTESGEYVDWGSNDHGAVLIGYGVDTVTIADPISGRVEYSRKQFESVFESRGMRCAILAEMDDSRIKACDGFR